MEEERVCTCNCTLSSFRELKSHIATCDHYLRKCFFFNNLDRIPKEASRNDLQLIQAELELTLDKIKERSQSSREKTQLSHPFIQTPQIVKKTSVDKASPGNMDNSVPIEIEEPGVFSHDIVECASCRNKFYSEFNSDKLFYVQECWHLFCQECIKTHIDKTFVSNGGTVNCPVKDCPQSIPRLSIMDLIGDEKLNMLEERLIKKINNIISCVHCKEEYIFEPGKPESLKDLNGKALTKEMERHYADNRFSCPNCKTEQCRTCCTTPYHVGKNCEQYKQHAEALKCRYCLEVMAEMNTRTGIKALEDICNKKECQEQAKKACSKILGCGHACSGVANEKVCLPCLKESCVDKSPELMGQKGEDYCAICYIESLDSAPCIRSECGHIFHSKCLQKRLEIRWIGPRILFNFCVCPLCKKWIQLSQENPLTTSISLNYALFQKIKGKCAERLKFEGCEKDPKLVDPGSPYFGKPTEYALAIFAYYQCFKCKEPYFGGRKACENAMQENAGEFNQKELVCSNCCEIPIENCPKHGKDYIEFKCKFCCSVAQWFCWGNTHFCEGCHQKQCKGEYISKFTKDKLPKCEGPDKCPVGGNHQGNGQEKAIGCAICRNIKQSGRNF